MLTDLKICVGLIKQIFWLSNTNNRSQGSNEKMDNVRYGVDLNIYFNWCMTGKSAIAFNYQVSNLSVIPQSHITTWANFLSFAIDFRVFETLKSWDISNIFIANETWNMKIISKSAKRLILPMEIDHKRQNSLAFPDLPCIPK